jgi:acyl-CoA thioesterase
MMDPQAMADACAAAMLRDDASTRSLGITIDQIAPGQARASMEVRPHMANGHGMCHGGLLFTLADTAFAFACNSYNQRVVAQHCSITFLRPAKVGMRLEALAAQRQRTARSGLYDVVVREAGGADIAEFRGHARALGQRFFEEPAP